MAYYPTAKSYMDGVLAASRDESGFGERERNALRGAYYTLLMQNGRALEHQKRVGHHRADVKLEQQGYTVYVGAAPDGGMTVEVEHHPHNWTNEYYMSGDRPIRKVLKPKGDYDIWKYDWNTGQFVPGSEYGPALFFSRDVEEIGEDTFLAEVEALRQKVGASEQWRDVEPETAERQAKLYALAGKVTPVERQSLYRRSYALFEGLCRRQAGSHPESPRVMEALNRILAIDWKRAPSNRRSHVLLIREFIRRISVCAVRMGQEADWPFFDTAEKILPMDPISPNVFSRLPEQGPHEHVRTICLWYVHWEQIVEQTDPEDGWRDNPYEPLLFLYERGGASVMEESGWAAVELNRLIKQGPEAHLQENPAVLLDAAGLDAEDGE